MYTLNIIMLRVGVSGAYRTYFNQRKVTPTKCMVQLSATMEQTHAAGTEKGMECYDARGQRSSSKNSAVMLRRSPRLWPVARHACKLGGKLPLSL